MFPQTVSSALTSPVFFSHSSSAVLSAAAPPSRLPLSFVTRGLEGAFQALQ